MSSSQKHFIHMSNRTQLGRNASKLRKEGLIVANVFGEEQPSQALTLQRSEVLRFLVAEGDAGLVYLKGEDKTEVPVLFDEIQYEPVSGEPLHIAFKRVNLKEKVRTEVPVEMIGEATIPGATVFLTKDVLEVEALPTDLPEQISIDISGLTEIGQSLHLQDAQYDRDAVTVILTEEEEENPLVIVQEHKEEVEEAPEEETVEGEENADEEQSSESESESGSDSSED